MHCAVLKEEKVKYVKAILAIVMILAMALPCVAAEPTDSAEAEKEEQAKGGVVMDTVVVSATRTETSAFEAPASVTVINEEEIEEQQGSSVRDILEDVPNVDFSSGTSPYYQVPSIRGLDDEQTIIKVDGAKQQYNDNAGNAKSPIVIDPMLLKQVEVLRGPSSALHGSGGIGGVISMRTKDASDFLKEGEKMGATVRTGYQSAEAQKHGTIAAYGQMDNFGFLVSGTNRDFNHLETSDPSGRNPSISLSGYSQTQFMKASWTPENQYASISYQNSRDRYNYEDGDWFKSRQNQTSVNYDISRGDLIDLKFAGQYTWRKNENDGFRDFTDTFRAWSGDLQNTFRFGKEGLFGNALTLGGDYQYNKQEGTVDGAVDASRPKATSTDAGMFIQDEISLPAGFTVIPALRFTHYTRKPTDVKADDAEESRLTPKFTGQWQATEWLGLFATYAESFRPPTANEMYFYMDWGVFEVLPNPDLKPETAKTWEFGSSLGFDGLVSNSDTLRMKMVYFRETIKDFMSPAQVGSDYTTINTGKVRRFGYEAELNYAYEDFSTAIGYGKVMGHDADTGSVTGSTPEQVNVRLGYSFPEQGLGFTWKSQFTGESKGWNPAYGNSDNVRPYHIHGMAMTWAPEDLWGYEGFKLNLGVDNIFDKKYRSYRGGLEKARNFKATVSLAF